MYKGVQNETESIVLYTLITVLQINFLLSDRSVQTGFQKCFFFFLFSRVLFDEKKPCLFVNGDSHFDGCLFVF